MNFQISSSWFTPERLLYIFCTINLLNYVDRGAIASNGVNGSEADEDCTDTSSCSSGTGIQGEFKLSNFEDGLLPAAFMIGLLIFAPIFAHASKSYPPFRLIGFGLLVWTIAVLSCGLSNGFYSILVARMFVGVGEASFISLAAPFIDDRAPPESKTTWLSLFFMCVPVGYALGYVLGGILGLFALSWRLAFYFVAFCMFPFVIFSFLVEPIPLKVKKIDSALINEEDGEVEGEGEDKSNSVESSKSFKIMELYEDMMILLKIPIYVYNVLGYVCYTFVIGAYSYWGPKAAKNIFSMEKSDVVFGIITVLTGILGTLFGGYYLDHIGSSISNAFKLQASVTFLGSLFCLFSFLAPSQWLFVLLLMVGEFFIFAIQGPSNVINFQSVPSHLRSLSIALLTISIHLFGDVPSPPLLGLLQDYCGNWRVSMSILTLVLFPATFIWAKGGFASQGLVSNFFPANQKVDNQNLLLESSNSSNSRRTEDPLLA